MNINIEIFLLYSVLEQNAPNSEFLMAVLVKYITLKASKFEYNARLTIERINGL